MMRFCLIFRFLLTKKWAKASKRFIRCENKNLKSAYTAYANIRQQGGAGGLYLAQIDDVVFTLN
jgi:hypothetical protein